MQFNDYQTETRATAHYPDVGNNFIFPTLGLVGEAGEVAEKIKKLIRDKATNTSAEINEIDRTEITKELGDVLWYLTQLATEIGVSLETVVTTNLVKTQSRRDRGQITGEGDNR